MAIGWELMGSKMAVVVRLLAALREKTDDKVVIVSNYTQVGLGAQGWGCVVRAWGWGWGEGEGGCGVRTGLGKITPAGLNLLAMFSSAHITI